MLRSLDNLRVLLGTPAYRSAVGERPGDVLVSAHWACGCSAIGPAFSRLALRTCVLHRTGRVEVPVTV